MSFIDQIDTGRLDPRGLQTPSSSGNTIIQPRNPISQSGRVSEFAQRTVDSLGRSVKTVINDAIAKNVTSPIRDAISRASGGLLGDFFEGFADEGQNIPPQYSGMVNQEQSFHEFMHTDRYVSEKYRLEQTADAVNEDHPMLKCMFVADFVFNTDAYYSENMMNMVPKSLTLGLKNSTFPRGEIETEEINSYNRSTISSRRVRYQPITATFGESVSHMVGGSTKASMIEIWEKIASFYINDMRNPDASLNASPLGHRSGNMHKNLIKYLDFYFIWPTATKRIRMVNPFITSFAYDNLDYSSDDQVLATFDIKYEYYQLTEIRGSFVDFINSSAGLAISAGMPYEFVEAAPGRNLGVVRAAEDLDDQRAVNLDNPYAQAALDLAQQNIINSASDLLGSNDPVDRELGRQAVERSLELGQTVAEATGIFSDAQDAVQGIGQAASGYISGLF